MHRHSITKAKPVCTDWVEFKSIPTITFEYEANKPLFLLPNDTGVETGADRFLWLLSEGKNSF